ncbi:histidine phosphatase family protein [Salinispora arenicola]|uniref:Phosphoglycerate mutase n=1 Tax=Salinispora arenicola (strain CNS-205) TaxID=391037 RepID=A8M0Y4_SALAI|nr:histidine phosphatase family protein [Salinispora arenicola]MCN0179593.1 histidine phosphatase family protein [Salinispora arenicola]NIL59344.1 histidine phosphatase family protein [Salinispora arenicola]NIL64609.1 histidine phosphatase family protein [Salinispora arenicola]
MTRLVVWRHGNTDWNASGRVQGQTDISLNDLGQEQAHVAARLLAGLRPDAIVASDLRRAADTAAALAALTSLPVRTDVRLRERYFGRWQGLQLTEAAERYPDEYARWRAGDPDPGAGIETLDDLGKRLGSALQEAADTVPGGTVVVATHGGAARQGIGQLLGWEPAVLRTVDSLRNCHWTELWHDDVRGWHLRAHNVGPS